MSDVARRAFLKILGLAPAVGATVVNELSAEAKTLGKGMGIFDAGGRLTQPPADWTINKIFAPPAETVFDTLLRYLSEEETLVSRQLHMFEDLEDFRSMSPMVKRVFREQRRRKFDAQLAYIANARDKLQTKRDRMAGHPTPGYNPSGYSMKASNRYHG